jgi:putative tryptophan/tyrosine transport system substrate-binding protein
MRRREFIAGLGGSAVVWPPAARAQQANSNRVRRLAVLVAYAETHPTAKVWIAAFRTGLQGFGWSGGRAVRIGLRIVGQL